MRVNRTDHAEPREQIESPGYRVNFWVQPRPGYAWNLDAYILTDVEDVREVLRWADGHAGGRRFEVFAETDLERPRPLGITRTSGLVRLLGSDPNAGESVEIVRLNQL